MVRTDSGEAAVVGIELIAVTDWYFFDVRSFFIMSWRGGEEDMF